MKKNIIYLIVIMVVIFLSGCGKKDQMVNFIPTPAVTPSLVEEEGDTPSETTDDIEEDTDTNTEGEQAEAPIKKPNLNDPTVTKYVKLTNYNGILNVRSKPSTDGESVGFLVHTEKIEVYTIENGWASFAMGDEIRYVSADFLVDKRPEYIDPPSPTPTLTPTPTPDPNEAPPEI